MDLILNLLDLNQSLNFSVIFACIGIFIALTWVMVAFWVGRDYYSKRGNILFAILWAIFVLIFSLPALMLYLIIRPEEQRGSVHPGGVAVPLVNFVDREGKELLLGIELKINPRKLTEATRDMVIDIDWEGKDPLKQISAESLQEQLEEAGDKVNKVSKIYKKLLGNLVKESSQSGTPVEGAGATSPVQESVTAVENKKEDFAVNHSQMVQKNISKKNERKSKIHANNPQRIQ